MTQVNDNDVLKFINLSLRTIIFIMLQVQLLVA